jgi:methionyl-tRNA formyltransferase
MRLAFMGTPDFAVPVLRALADAKQDGASHDIARVYTQPPRPAGRGKALRPSPVHAAAEAMGLAVATPGSFRDPAVLADFAALKLDAAVVVAYGQILPCTPRCCRAGAARRRSSGRSWPAMRGPGSA